MPGGSAPIAATPGPGAEVAAGAEAAPTGAPAVDDLPIDGYDQLGASQIVARLEGLAPGELEAVRRYERSGRQRRTILTRIQQLSPPADG